MVLNNAAMIWVLLALPAAFMLRALEVGAADANDLVHPSGETAARLMVLAMAIGPLVEIVGRRPWTLWLLARRRWIGFAAFAYALLHLAFYVGDMGAIDDILAEFTERASGPDGRRCSAWRGRDSPAPTARWRHWGATGSGCSVPHILRRCSSWCIGPLLELRWGPALMLFVPLAMLNLCPVSYKQTNHQEERNVRMKFTAIVALAGIAGSLALATPALADGKITCRGGPKSGWTDIAKLKEKLTGEGWAIRKAGDDSRLLRSLRQDARGRQRRELLPPRLARPDTDPQARQDTLPRRPVTEQAQQSRLTRPGAAL